MVATHARALVTGASSGIGEALAWQLALAGTHLVLVARSEHKLEELAAEIAAATGVTVEALPADLTNSDQLALVDARLADDEEPIDLLINNAGFGHARMFAEGSVSRYASMIALNVEALTLLSQTAAAVMSPRGYGTILNVGSIVGLTPVSTMAVYAATKAYVQSFTEALHEELRDAGVLASVLIPGPTRTAFAQAAGSSSPAPGAAWQSAEEVAKAALAGLDHCQAVIAPSAALRLGAATSRLVPPALRRAALRRLALDRLTIADHQAPTHQQPTADVPNVPFKVSMN